jgi:hypothetical protein
MHRNLRSREPPLLYSEGRSPYWLTGAIPKRRDIARLKPPSLPKGRRFETDQDAQEQSRRQGAALLRGRHPERLLAEVLSDCREGYYQWQALLPGLRATLPPMVRERTPPRRPQTRGQGNHPDGLSC